MVLGTTYILCRVHRRVQSLRCFQHEVFGTGEYAWLNGFRQPQAVAHEPEGLSRRWRQYHGTSRVVGLDGAARTGT
jgi:hypothetical protein